MSLKNLPWKLFSGLALAAALSGCSSNELIHSENPEIIYNETERLIDKGRYTEAQEFVTEIRKRFPQSRFAALAELRNADIYFKQDDFTEAAAAYGVFVELYPNHKEAAYAQYQRALSYFNDAPDLVARDQEPARAAVNAAETLLSRYPDSEFSKKGEDIRLKARLRLAEKEAYIARFYTKKDHVEAARGRWKGLLASYSDLSTYEPAKALLEEAHKKSEE